MAIHPFLAMTAAEMRGNSSLPGKIAWMACHFSPYGTGLSNLPAALPPDSLLILNDRTPIHGHDPELIARQLGDCVRRLGCRGLLLDFQRPGCAETAELAKFLTNVLSFPVGVSEFYAADADCPVFLAPVPPSMPLEAHIAPWEGREVWLELALGGEVITLTEQGAEATPLPFADDAEQCFAEDRLHCHYKIDLEENAARFTLWRTPEDLEELTSEAEAQGIPAMIGLYQELHPVLKNKM